MTGSRPRSRQREARSRAAATGASEARMGTFLPSSRWLVPQATKRYPTLRRPVSARCNGKGEYGSVMQAIWNCVGRRGIFGSSPRGPAMTVSAASKPVAPTAPTFRKVRRGMVSSVMAGLPVSLPRFNDFFEEYARLAMDTGLRTLARSCDVQGKNLILPQPGGHHFGKVRLLEVDNFTRLLEGTGQAAGERSAAIGFSSRQDER